MDKLCFPKYDENLLQTIEEKTNEIDTSPSDYKSSKSTKGAAWSAVQINHWWITLQFLYTLISSSMVRWFWTKSLCISR